MTHATCRNHLTVEVAVVNANVNVTGELLKVWNYRFAS